MNILRRIAVLTLCIVLAVTSVSLSGNFSASADVKDEIAKLQQQSAALQKEINRLKNEKKDQSAILAAIQKKIANTQAQIDACTSQISGINSKIAANKAEIDKNNQEIEKNKLAFKKRLRAIYMSNSESSVQILLGAEDFSDFLQITQLTSAVSSHDKAIIEDIVEAIDELNRKNAENEELLKQQVSIRDSIQSQQNQLESEENEAMAIYNQISNEQKENEKDQAAIQNEIKEKQEYLDSLASGGSSHSFVNSNSGFMWPVPYTRNITSGWGERWGTMHRGIDISSGGIYGKPIVAIADGYVYRSYTACSHKSKSSRCRCGSGWGNHVGINHGTMNGAEWKAIYAHMNSVVTASVGQYVKQGQVIGYVGTTGDSTGYHLHLSLIKNGSYVNPYPYFFG